MTHQYIWRREQRIEEIKEMLKDNEKEGEFYSRKKLITAISVKYNVSRRTAAEYLDAAQFQLTL